MGLSQTIRLHAAQKSKLIPVITNLLDDQDGYIRAAAAQALGEHGESQAAGKLTSLLSDADARVQHFAAIALSKLGASSTLPQVVTMLEKSNNADPVLRHAGIVALEKLAPNAEALTALKSHANTAVRRAAVVALRRRGEAAIAEYLSDSDPLVVAEAARAIHDRPIPAALPALAKIANRAGLDDETAFRP